MVERILSALRSVPFPELTSLEIICFPIYSSLSVDEENFLNKTLLWFVKSCLMPKLETVTVKCE